MLRTRSSFWHIAYVLTDMLSMYHGGIESSVSHSLLLSIYLNIYYGCAGSRGRCLTWPLRASIGISVLAHSHTMQKWFSDNDVIKTSVTIFAWKILSVSAVGCWSKAEGSIEVFPFLVQLRAIGPLSRLINTRR